MRLQEDQVERWAKHIKSHPEWKKQLRPFIDSQIIMANRFYSRLAETEEGRKKLIKLGKVREQD